jgi:hypothetical protein
MDLEFNDDGLLIATYDTEICFKWTYSDFEKYLNESVTPSMYEYMAGCVYSNATEEDLWKLQDWNYTPGELEEEAVYSYFNLPALDRLTMHAQTIHNLKAERQRAEDKEIAARNLMTDDEGHPFDPTSPIYVEMTNFLNKIACENQKKCEKLDKLIHEEEQWRGGWEAGESPPRPMYDSAGEV